MRAFTYGRVVLLLLALTAAGCHSQRAATVSPQEGERSQLDFKNFDEITCKAPVDLFISQGETFLVEVEVLDQEASDRLEFKMHEREFIIKEEKASWWSGQRAKGPIANIYITLPRLEELSLASAGNAKLMTPFTTSKAFEISIAGSGSLTGTQVHCAGEAEFSIAGSGSVDIAQLDAHSFEADIAGSGNVKVSTLACSGELEGNIAGSGRIALGHCRAQKADFSIGGSGDASVETLVASGTVEVEVVGSGNVKFGELAARRFTVSSMGSGDVYVDKLQEGTQVSQSGVGSGTIRIGR